MDTPGLTKIETVVYEVMNDLNQTSMGDFKRYLQWAIRGFKRLNIFHINNPETLVSKVSDLNTITLPNDYIAYTRVGFLHRNEIVPITRNDAIIKAFKIEDGAEVLSDFMKATEPLVNYTWLAKPPKTFDVFEFTEDRRNSRLIFKGRLNNVDIVVEYLTTGIKIDGQTYIPETAIEALVAYIHWQRSLNGKGTLNEVAYRERLWTDAVDLVTNSEYSITPDDFIDAITSGYSQLPR